jgi:hypothetical protein
MNAAESELVSVRKNSNVWRVASLHSSRVRMYLGTNQAGFQKMPVTLRDSTNEWGSDVRVTDSILID